MKDKNIFKDKKLIVLIILLVILIFSYVILIIYNYNSLKKYDYQILPGISIDNIDMSGYSYDNSLKRLDYYSDHILNQKVKLEINSKDYEYSLKDLGLTINASETLDKVSDFQNSLNYSKRLRLLNGKDNINFDVVFDVDSEKLKEFLDGIKSRVDVNVVNGTFNVLEGVKYIKGTDGYSLDVDKSFDKIKDAFEGKLNYRKKIVLIGDTVASNSSDSYSSIDTMTSSFVTKFNVGEGTRPINLRTALNYINGAIVEPGEVFSYYKYAGPYDKAGYVFYYEFVGNGVCQIATTVYNAALLGGLEIVKRYPHAKKSVYVPGGLDATVASYSSGWNVDFQFKNTYKYPIYIKAYAVGGEAHVEFWSNSKAMDGKTYSTESVSIGRRGYTTYLHTYKDGKELSRDKITTTWYTEE